VRWGDQARICERVDSSWDTYRRIAKNGEGFVLHTPVLLEMSNDGGANDL
jgi:hypothetical protein